MSSDIFKCDSIFQPVIFPFFKKLVEKYPNKIHKKIRGIQLLEIKTIDDNILFSDKFKIEKNKKNYLLEVLEPEYYEIYLVHCFEEFTKKRYYL